MPKSMHKHNLGADPRGLPAVYVHPSFALSLELGFRVSVNPGV